MASDSFAALLTDTRSLIDLPSLRKSADALRPIRAALVERNSTALAECLAEGEHRHDQGDAENAAPDQATRNAVSAIRGVGKAKQLAQKVSHASSPTRHDRRSSCRLRPPGRQRPPKRRQARP